MDNYYIRKMANVPPKNVNGANYGLLQIFQCVS